LPARLNAVIWDGMNTLGQQVASGVDFLPANFYFVVGQSYLLFNMDDGILKSGMTGWNMK
jgi:hypothetical protein